MRSVLIATVLLVAVCYVNANGLLGGIGLELEIPQMRVALLDTSKCPDEVCPATAAEFKLNPRWSFAQTRFDRENSVGDIPLVEFGPDSVDSERYYVEITGAPLDVSTEVTGRELKHLQRHQAIWMMIDSLSQISRDCPNKKQINNENFTPAKNFVNHYNQRLMSDLTWTEEFQDTYTLFSYSHETKDKDSFFSYSSRDWYISCVPNFKYGEDQSDNIQVGYAIPLSAISQPSFLRFFYQADASTEKYTFYQIGQHAFNVAQRLAPSVYTQITADASFPKAAILARMSETEYKKMEDTTKGILTAFMAEGILNAAASFLPRKSLFSSEPADYLLQKNMRDQFLKTCLNDLVRNADLPTLMGKFLVDWAAKNSKKAVQDIVSLFPALATAGDITTSWQFILHVSCGKIRTSKDTRKDSCTSIQEDSQPFQKALTKEFTSLLHAVFVPSAAYAKRYEAESTEWYGSYLHIHQKPEGWKCDGDENKNSAGLAPIPLFDNVGIVVESRLFLSPLSKLYKIVPNLKEESVKQQMTKNLIEALNLYADVVYGPRETIRVL